jgi:hypothetical protein
MRKSPIFLLAIFVCALGSTTTAQAQSESNSQTQNGVSVEQSISAGKGSDAALPSSDIFSRIAEARSLLSARQTFGTPDLVTIAAFDPATSIISVFSVLKTEFLVKDADLSATTQAGSSVRVHVVRANGVNTAVTVADVSTGRTLVPLLVQFPIVKGGAVAEMAYYTSAHPALLSPVVSDAGKTYVRRMLDAAAGRLAGDGVAVPSDIVDIAEHLCIVEHTDHKRFMNENHTALFPEILSLYALNEGNTFRYSVSTAGAGGMIQMIPRTYEAIRQQHSNVTLQSDFVDGMRDHGNALEAMLLYMNDTWNNLSQNSEVQDALRNGVATKPELLAAGYNSNPMRLPAYLKNGGAQWRTLIPAETQMYLSIYHSIDDTLQLGSRSTDDNPSTSSQAAPILARFSSLATIMSLLGHSLQPSGLFVGRLLY